VNNAPASQVFAALAADSRYSIVVHPDVTGKLTIALKDVTLPEALDSIREVYGYDYKITGDRVTIQPLTLQTRLFQINYLSANRIGLSDTRVISGSITANGGGSSSSSATGASSGASSSSASGAVSASVQTYSKADFWAELSSALKLLVGDGEGRQVIASPQSGVIVVKAMPAELRAVDSYLHMSQLSIEREVMLEAKIVEVVLSDGYQNGINWAALSHGRAPFSVGADPSQILVSPGTPGTIGSSTGFPANTTLGDLVTAPISGAINTIIPNSPLSGALGLNFATSNFAAILSYLETQGSIHVMSSPRIATLNNQKAVLKVGTDDFFVTNVSTTTTSSGSGNTVSPSITLQPFFSGISLDVMPQIDADDNVMLHIRPSISNVTENKKIINLGTAGVFQLPLASSRTNETDSIVRVREGNIVAIGGLMEQAQTNDSAKVPGVGDMPVVGEFFSQGKKALQKRELVVLLKATIIRGDKDWGQDVRDTAERLSGIKQEPLGPQW
jgi:MSHA biogenesis protein MshL